MEKINNWTDAFPGNFQWSNATLVCKGMAPYGAVSLNEIDTIINTLKLTNMAPLDWVNVWKSFAQKNINNAEEYFKNNHQKTAGLHYLRAGNYMYTGERFIQPGPEKLEISRIAFDAYHKGFELSHPDIEYIKIPYEETYLPGLFIPANKKEKSPSPTVLILNGMDNCKEMSALFAGLEFAKRGFNTLALDGPGQGESLRLLNIKARYDYEVPASCAYEYLVTRDDVDNKKIAIVGYSFGGYYASRIAANDNRYCAGIALTSGHWDLYEFQKNIFDKLKSSSKSTAQSNFQFQWVVGADSIDEALEASKAFSVKNNASKIKIPFLITHGENDRIVPVKNAYKFYENLTTSEKELRIFTKEEGATEHAHVDDRQLGINYAADWLEKIIGVIY
ncbi:MAG: alpha/beta fold hydrolase [Rhizobiales bacterium]|nr:alpha/beta fold hydrolase [Hyphomicrobiales bacterium]MBL6769823.1 alpha/beta fold hydrolase [Hyphomicrobiales bacterium]